MLCEKWNPCRSSGILQPHLPIPFQMWMWKKDPTKLFLALNHVADATKTLFYKKCDINILFSVRRRKHLLPCNLCIVDIIEKIFRNRFYFPFNALSLVYTKL